MPIFPPLNYPLGTHNYNYYHKNYRSFPNNVSGNIACNTPINYTYINDSNPNQKKHSLPSENVFHDKHQPEEFECFFELFGLKLHFDDVLIICILFFLYNEDVHDYELFLCLILLLLS